MIVLDTNVVSELMRPTPAAAVRGWVVRHPATALYTTSITQAEVLYGIELMASGKRRDAVREAAQAMFGASFAGRILPFGSNAALAYAQVTAKRRRSGKPINQADGQIAAIVLAAGASLATRNVADFDATGVKVIDPWKS